MKKLVIFVVFLIGCSEEHETVKKICSPFRMTISDASPVQFWVNGVETYNQKEVCGITPACFCQPFNCDDEIRIQLQENTGVQVSLILYDLSGNEITELRFSEITSGVYQISFTPSELGITNEQIRLSIVYGDFQNGGFNGTLNPWANFGSGTDWTVVSDKASVTNSSGVSKRLRQAYGFISGVEYTISFDLTTSGAGVSMQVTLTDLASNEFWTSGDVLNPTYDPVVTGSFSITFTPDANYNYINFYISNSAGVSRTITVDNVSIESNDLANSDCIDIRESHECTALIRYVNSKDFADIEYSDFSPSAEFYIRVPAVFFHLRPQTEQEDFETSGQTIVRLRNEIKKRHLLELGYMPDYMHLKLMLILAHDTVEIDGEQWVQRDPYEIIPPSNKRYPLKMANVILTQQGYIKRNIL